jgi:small GTP-binding protein
MMQAPPVAPSTRAKTGIPVLDGRLQGGFPRPSTLLLFSDKPTEKRIFGENFAVQGVKAGETCLYVDFFRAPQLARGELKRFGAIDASKLVLVDATSSQMLLPSREKYHIDDVGNLANVREAIIAATRAERPARIIVDSMEFLMDRFPKEDVLKLWRELITAARAAGAVICFLFINWTLQEQELEEIRAMSDFVVEFQSSLRGGIVRNSMRISQMAEAGIRTNWIPYMFKDLFGLTVYFPRILVTGPFNAGKSTVVKSLSEKAVSIDRMGTTVAFDYGNVNITGIEAEVFGTPGQERFEFIFKIFAREVSGVLLVVDATRPEELGRARQMLDLVGPRIPYVVLANKSDLPGALSASEIGQRMGLEPDLPVIPTVATENKGVRDAIVILAEMIIGVR